MPMKKEEYNKIVAEVNNAVKSLKSEGSFGEELRTKVIEMVDASVQVGFRANFFEILMSPDAGIRYAYASHEAIGAVNDVLSANDLAPLHIKELPFTNDSIVKMVEGYLGKTIDEVFADIEKEEK